MRPWRILYLPLTALLLVFNSPVYAQSQEETEATEQASSSTKATATEENTDAQSDDDDNDEMMLDNLQRGVQASVDATARWFDGFFGDSRTFDDERYRSQGRVSVAPQWTDYEDWRVRSSLRARINLPIAENRFSAVIGRVDTDDYVVGEDSERRASVLRNIEGDSEWLVGLGFNPGQGEENRFSVTGGIRGGLRADLYTEARYLYQKRLTDNAQVRTRSAAFWRDSDGFGFAQRIDYEHTWGPEWLIRLANEGTFAERVEGIRLRNSASIYHLYAEERAIAFQVSYAGETRAEVRHRDIATRLIHRQSWLREWFYVEKWVGMHWPKELPDEKRKGAWMVGIEFELWYGR